MTVQDLLKAAPHEELIEFFIPYRFEDVAMEDRPKLKDRLDVWMQGLINRSVTEREDMLLAHISYVENERFAVNVVKRQEVEKWVVDGMRVVDPNPDDPASAYPHLPQIYGIFFSDWDDVLGLQVDEHNVAEHGVNLFLFEVLREMSFNGFDEADMVKERDELIKRVERLNAMIPEKRDASCRPMNEVFREMSEKYGFEYHEDTEEEKAERGRKIKEDVRREYVERYRVMKNYVTSTEQECGRYNREECR